MKSCIFMISSRKNVLETCIRLLYENFNNKYNYPVLIFYMDDIYDNLLFQEKIKKYGNIKFINIPYQIPSHIQETELFYNRTEIPYVKKCFPKSRIGYLHANYFWNNFMNFKELQDYDFGMRIDDDSFFIKPINFSFFEELNNNLFGTGFTDNKINKNIIDCRVELHNFTKNFIDKYGYEIKDKYLKDLIANDKDDYLKNDYINWNCGNCNIYDFNLFKDEKWKKWNQEFNDFAGGYKYRWGDIEVIGLYCYLFLDNPVYDFKLKEKGLYETGNTNWIRVGTAPSTKN